MRATPTCRSVVETAGGPIVQIPGSDFTDNRTLRSSPQDIWDVYKETFDYLRACEPPGFLAMSMHCHFGGRPMITAVYEKIFGYMRRHDDVWFCVVRRDRALGDQKQVRVQPASPPQGLRRDR